MQDCLAYPASKNNIWSINKARNDTLSSILLFRAPSAGWRKKTNISRETENSWICSQHWSCLHRETSGKPKEKEIRWQIRRQEGEDGELCVMNMNVIKTDISAVQDRAYIYVWITFEIFSSLQNERFINAVNVVHLLDQSVSVCFSSEAMTVVLLYPARPASLLLFPGSPAAAAGTGWPAEKQPEKESLFVCFYNISLSLPFLPYKTENEAILHCLWAHARFRLSACCTLYLDRSVGAENITRQNITIIINIMTWA